MESSPFTALLAIPSDLFERSQPATVERYRSAIIAIAASSLVNSSSGVLVRQVEVASEWQIIALRGCALVVGLSMVLCIQQRGRVLSGFWQTGRWGLMGAFFQTLASICYIHSLQNTTVANTLFVLSAAPLATAILARIRNSRSAFREFLQLSYLTMTFDEVFTSGIAIRRGYLVAGTRNRKRAAIEERAANLGDGHHPIDTGLGRA